MVVVVDLVDPNVLEANGGSRGRSADLASGDGVPGGASGPAALVEDFATEPSTAVW